VIFFPITFRVNCSLSWIGQVTTLGLRKVDETLPRSTATLLRVLQFSRLKNRASLPDGSGASPAAEEMRTRPRTDIPCSEPRSSVEDWSSGWIARGLQIIGSMKLVLRHFRCQFHNQVVPCVNQKNFLLLCCLLHEQLEHLTEHSSS